MPAPIHTRPGDRCPDCAAVLDQAVSTGSDPAPPAEGDISACAYCGLIVVFEALAGLRRITPAEWKALPIAQRAALVRVTRAIMAPESFRG